MNLKLKIYILIVSPLQYEITCIEKDLADALLLRSFTLALGLVEEGIWVWAPQLASLRV